MAQETDVQLLNFFVFNPTCALTEGEEEKKILYYHPSQTDKDNQLKNAGLCEALIKFTGSFSPSKPCQSFSTEKTKQFLFEAEENFWLVLTVTVPISTKTNGVVQTTEHQSWKVQDNVYNALLVQAYNMFKLFNGTFKSIMNSKCEGENDQSSVLKQKLYQYFNQYVSSWSLSHCDILDVFGGITYLPLGKEPFLHVQSFINLVETTFQPVCYSAFLYNDHLVWSGIEPEDMQVLYQYLIHKLLPQHPDLELQGGSLPSVDNSIHHYGSFVTGPSNLKHSIVSTRKVPTVYLCNNNKTERFHLVVYRALSATLCLFIHHDDPLTLDLFKKLDDHLGPRLTTLVSEVTAHCARQASQSTSDHSIDDAKFVYYNNLNLAHKSTVHVDTKHGRASGLSVPVDLLRIAAHVNADKSGCSGFGEVIMKTLNDCWLVAKFSNSREFYVILTQKKASLVKINETVKKICDSELKGIFFMD